MAYEGTYAPENVEYHVQGFYPNTFYSTMAALFCIFIILRYSSRTMGESYRFHLLNITIWTLFCDLNITLLTQFYSLNPVSGGCYPGVLPKLLMIFFRADTSAHLTTVSYLCFKGDGTMG
jgi:hypothetical protein